MSTKTGDPFVKPACHNIRASPQSLKCHHSATSVSAISFWPLSREIVWLAESRTLARTDCWLQTRLLSLAAQHAKYLRQWTQFAPPVSGAGLSHTKTLPVSTRFREKQSVTVLDSLKTKGFLADEVLKLIVCRKWSLVANVNQVEKLRIENIKTSDSPTVDFSTLLQRRSQCIDKLHINFKSKLIKSSQLPIARQIIS